MIDCTKTENYFAEKARMTKKHILSVSKKCICGIDCVNCPLDSLNNGTNNKMSCSEFEALYPEKAMEKVQKWSDEHPMNTYGKTYLSEFLKHYPKTRLDKDGTPHKLCPWHLGLMSVNGCRNDCVNCWNQLMEESENNE